MGKATEGLYKQIEDGLKDMVKFSTGLSKLEYWTDPVRKGVFTVVGASSGSGKSTFVIFNYIYKPICDAINQGKTNLRIIIFCLEMTKEATLSKLLSMLMYDKYGIEIGYKEMQSIAEKMDDDTYAKLQECRTILEKMEGYIIFVEGRLNASAFSEYMIKYYMRRGQFCNEGKTLYIPNDEKLVTLAIIDHIGETYVGPKETERQAQDALANEAKEFRNICGLSSIIIQQINRGASTVDRRTKFPGIEMQDLKGTGGAAEKADNVIGLYYPYRDKLKKWGDYDVLRMKQVLRGIQILKNRWGTADINIGLAFYGHPCVMKELPREITTDYSIYDTPLYYRGVDTNEIKTEDI